MANEPVKVCVTGAAGQIAYSLLYSIAKGDVFGREQRIILTLLDIKPMQEVMDGVVMELQDCCFPLLIDVIPTVNEEEAFKDIDAAFLVGAMPRREGMERRDLLSANINIFNSQGQALNKFAKRTVKVLVVGNPANTNALVCSNFAPDIPKENFSCLTRLDQNRAQYQIAAHLEIPVESVEKVIIWGNHSSTQVPDASHAIATIDNTKVPVLQAISDDDFVQKTFIPTVQQRGAAVIKARKLSSAMSAAKAAADHMKDWWCGTQGRWVSMGVFSPGLYKVPKEIMYSFPVTIADGKWTIVENLDISEDIRVRMDQSAAELREEKAMAEEINRQKKSNTSQKLQ